MYDGKKHINNDNDDSGNDLRMYCRLDRGSSRKTVGRSV